MKPALSKIKRTIATVVGELQTALKGETTSVIEIGGLLIEAKEMLDHGEWLPWLKVKFGSSLKTADNYMNASRLANWKRVTNLKLRPTALYLLGGKLDDPLFPPEAVEAILEAAKTEWVNGKRALAIANSVLNPPPSPEEIEKRRQAEEIEKKRGGERGHTGRPAAESTAASGRHCRRGPPPVRQGRRDVGAGLHQAAGQLRRHLSREGQDRRHRRLPRGRRRRAATGGGVISGGKLSAASPPPKRWALPSPGRERNIK